MHGLLVVLTLGQAVSVSSEFELVNAALSPGRTLVGTTDEGFLVAVSTGRAVLTADVAPFDENVSFRVLLDGGSADGLIVVARGEPQLVWSSTTAVVQSGAFQNQRGAPLPGCAAQGRDGAFFSAREGFNLLTAQGTLEVERLLDAGLTPVTEQDLWVPLAASLDGYFCATTVAGAHVFWRIQPVASSAAQPVRMRLVDTGVERTVATTFDLTFVGSGRSSYSLITRNAGIGEVLVCGASASGCVDQPVSIGVIDSVYAEEYPLLPGSHLVVAMRAGVARLHVIGGGGEFGPVLALDGGSTQRASVAFLGRYGLLSLEHRLSDGGAWVGGRWLNALRAGDPCSALETCIGGRCLAGICVTLDAGSDAGVADSGLADAGTDGGRADAGPPDGGADAGFLDAGALDAGPDASVDAGIVDAGIVDAGELDAGELDAGELDAGELDAGELDAGAADAGARDAGSLTLDEPLALAVGCGCAAAPVPSLLVVTLVAVLRRRRRR